MTTTTPPRGGGRAPVPSERERALGVTSHELRGPAGGEPVELSQDEERRPLFSLRGFLADIRPSVATGGASPRPLLLLALPGIGRGFADAVYRISFPTLFFALSLDYRKLTTIGVISAVLSTLSAVGLGFIADRFNRRGTLMAATFLFGLSYVVFGLSPTFALFVVFSLWKTITGGLNVVAAPNTSLLADFYPPEVRGRVFAFNANISLVLVALFATVAALLVKFLGFETAFIIGGIVACLSFIPLLFVREPPRGRWDRIRLGASEEAASRAEDKPRLGEAFRIIQSVRTIRRVCAAQVWLTISGLVALPLSQIKAIQAFGPSPGLQAVIAISQTLLTVVSFELGGVFSDRILRRRPELAMTALGCVYIVNVVVLIITAFVGIPWLLLVISFVQVVVSQIPTTGEQVLLSLVTPARVRSFGQTFPQLYGLVGMVVAFPFLFLLPQDSVGALLIAGALIALPGAFLFLSAKVDVQADIKAARAAVLAAETALARRADGGRTMLVCRDVEVGYDGVQVLFGVDLDVAEGELIALLGTNGAGKSTLLRAVTGLSEPSGGAVFIDGVDATHMPPHEIARLGVVFMPGGRGVFPTLTVAENLSLVGAAGAARADEVYELFPQLAQRRDSLAGNLSGGEQQMVALGQALLAEPRLLLVDELSLGLAPAVVEQLLQALTAIHARGTTVILVEQSVDLALTVAERAVFMEKGEIRFDGSAAELRARPELLRSIYVKGTRAGTTSAPRTPRAVDIGSAALRVADLSVRYGGVAALTDATLEVAPGEVVGLIGPNGAGKTTLFDAVCGFAPITSGRVEVTGRDVTDLTPGERSALGLGRSFQDARLFSALTVTENVMVALHRKQTGGATAAALWLPQARRAEAKLRRRAEGYLDALGLTASRDKVPAELSTGTRRILDLACLMAAAPDVLLLDEPSSGIAQAEAEELGPLLDRIRRDLGCAIVLIEHDMSLLTSVADRLVGMVLGRTVVTGTVAEVTADPRMVAAYLGTTERVLARSARSTTPSQGETLP